MNTKLLAARMTRPCPACQTKESWFAWPASYRLVPAGDSPSSAMLEKTVSALKLEDPLVCRRCGFVALFYPEPETLQ
jgi:hypothetical protein